MNKKRDPLRNGEPEEIGAPFEAFGGEKYPYNSNTRIMPSQFQYNFPNIPMNYMVIRDITDNNLDKDIKD